MDGRLKMQQPDATKFAPRGFSLLEILVVLAIVALLAQVAITGYASYVARARAADLALVFDELRTRTGVATRGASVVDSCAAVAQQIQSNPVSSDYAAVDIAFEPVANGLTPMLRFCATSTAHGGRGIDVTREAHNLLSRVTSMGKGAVIGESAVSFAVPLADGTAVCKVAPVASATPACGAAPAQSTGVAAPAVVSGASSTAVTATSSAATASPIVVPPPLPKVTASVMKFSGSGTFARPVGSVLDTRGDLRAFTLDMSFIGDGSVPASSGGQGPVMFNYGGSADAHNAISLWNPRSLTIALLNQNLNTGINLIDGQTHRVTASWDSATGRIAIYDNGRLVKTFDDVSKGQVIRGGGSMVIAHKDNGNGNYAPGEAFAGQIFRTALANRAVTAAEAVRPLNQILDTASGLVIDVVAQGAKVLDTTGRHQIETGGVTVITTGVEGNLVNR